MRALKRLTIVAAIAGLGLAAGTASAIPLNWTKTFTVTGIGSNVPQSGTEAQGTLWLYAPKTQVNNQTTTVTIGTEGPALTPTNPGNGNPVEYTLTGIMISGGATSLRTNPNHPIYGEGIDSLDDIRGEVTRVLGGTGTTNYVPFLGAVGCLGSDSLPKIYTTADLDTLFWTGACDGGPYVGGTFPDVTDFSSQIVTDLTQFSLFFWNNTVQTADQPEARLDGLTVSFVGTCTGNCTTGGGTAPEPATLALLGLGLAGLGALRRRRGD